MNARKSENYLAISRLSSASKSVEIFWAEIFFTHRNHAWWHINDQILHYEPTSWPSKQVFDELLCVCVQILIISL
jgi:hypothetical protein